MGKDVELNLMQEVKRRFTILCDQYDMLQEVPDAFFESNTVMKSETLYMLGRDFHGVLFELNDEEKELIKGFENKYHSLVYHVIKNDTEIGTLYSLFYVSDYPEEWAMCRKELLEGYPIIYCINASDDFCSEFGSISIKKSNGGLRRVY